MTPTEKEQLWNSIYRMRSMPYKGPRGGLYYWTYREIRNLYEKLVVYGDADEPTAAWRLLNSKQYRDKIYPANKGEVYDAITFAPPPVPKSMWVGYLADTSGGSFSNFPTDWILNGDLLFNAVTLITSPPYSGNGYAIQVYDPFDPYCSGCLFRAYTIEDIGFVMPTPWTGTDNNGTPISMSFTEITTKKSFSGTITPGSDTINWIVTGSFSDYLDFPQFLSDPMVSTYLTIIFQRLFGSQASVTVVVNGGGSFTITVSDIYTTDAQIGFYMGDAITYYIPEV